MQRVRVVLVAHGEAKRAGWLENFRVSWRTLAHAAEVMRLPAPLRLMICTLGALRKRLRGGPGSPHNENTRRQASALQQALDRESGVRYQVDAAFASAPPYLEDQIAIPDGVDRQIMVSMIPTDSRLSCGLICRSLLASAPSNHQRTIVSARFWADHELTDTHLAHIAAHFPPITSDRSCCLILVLHGTIERDEHGREPGFHTGSKEKAAYGDALRSALLAVPDRRWDRVEIAYLNHGVGGQWSSPTLPELLARLATEGVQSAVAYPCEHLVEGSETVSLPKSLADGPVGETHCLPCLNDSAQFIEFLASRVRTALHAPRTEYCCEPCPLRAVGAGQPQQS